MKNRAIPNIPLDYAASIQDEVIDRISIIGKNDDDFIEQSRIQFPEAVKVVTNSIGKDEHSAISLELLGNNFGNLDFINGLSSKEAEQRLLKYGSNISSNHPSMPIWKVFLYQFISPVVILLIGAGIGSIILREYAGGIAIIVTLLMNSTLASYMEKSASNELAKLANLSNPTCIVLRDGKDLQIETKDLVPGDIVKFSTGNTIPADIRLIECRELLINESVLTGESVDIEKDLVARESNSPFPSNMCFSSSLITSGSGSGFVVIILICK